MSARARLALPGFDRYVQPDRLACFQLNGLWQPLGQIAPGVIDVNDIQSGQEHDRVVPLRIDAGPGNFDLPVASLDNNLPDSIFVWGRRRLLGAILDDLEQGNFPFKNTCVFGPTARDQQRAGQ